MPKHKDLLKFDKDKIQLFQRNGTYLEEARYSSKQLEAILAVITHKEKRGGSLRDRMRELLVDHKNKPQRLFFITGEYTRINTCLKRGAINGKHYRLVEHRRHFQLWEIEPHEKEPAS